MTPVSSDDLEAAPVIHVETIGSTNDEALGRARAGEPGPLWIRADEQTKGRGRRDRGWASPKGNLYASLLLSNPGPRQVLPQLAHVAAVALVDAVQRTAGPIPGLAIKWPNDLLIGSAKLAGILVEATSTSDGAAACVIGCGVNCASNPGGLGYPATNLRDATGASIDLATLFAAFRSSMTHALREWDRGAGYERIQGRWMAAALPLGTPLRVKRSSADLLGRFQGIDTHGRLRLALPEEILVIEAGDVFLEEQAAASVG